MNTLIGYGKSYSSFGEVIQGRLSNQEDFLITIPIDLWSTCELICEKIEGPTKIDCIFEKSKIVAEKMVEILNLDYGYYVKIIFTRNIPIGKGLSSSTADMLAVVRAFQEVFGVIVTEPFISNLFSEIEAHDALHYYMSVIYNHRKGKLLRKLNHIPLYNIIAIDEGTIVDTVDYNKNLKFTPNELKRYDELYRDIIKEFEKKDDIGIARLSTDAAIIHAERTNNKFLSEIIKKSKAIDNCLGVIATHSGSFVGLLFRYDLPQEMLKVLIKEISNEVNKDVLNIKTLRLI